MCLLGMSETTPISLPNMTTQIRAEQKKHQSICLSGHGKAHKVSTLYKDLEVIKES